MRNRNKKISDFGLSKDQIWEVYRRCEHLTEAEQGVLRSISLQECPPEIADLVTDSLIHRESYDVISSRKYIPLGINDFYGYRRKVASKFYFFLCEESK